MAPWLGLSGTLPGGAVGGEGVRGRVAAAHASLPPSLPRTHAHTHAPSLHVALAPWYQVFLMIQAVNPIIGVLLEVSIKLAKRCRVVHCIKNAPQVRGGEGWF